jgi:hypothetical protein
MPLKYGYGGWSPLQRVDSDGNRCLEVLRAHVVHLGANTKYTGINTDATTTTVTI